MKPSEPSKPVAKPAPQPYQDDDEKDGFPPQGSAEDVRDEGPLDSLGKSIIQPVRDAAGEPAKDKAPR